VWRSRRSDMVIVMKFALLKIKKDDSLPIEVLPRGSVIGRLLIEILEEILFFFRSRRGKRPFLPGPQISRGEGIIHPGFSVSERQGFAGTIHGERFPSPGDLTSGPPVNSGIMDADSYLAELRDERLREDRSEKKRRGSEDDDQIDLDQFKRFKPEDWRG